MDEDDDDDDDDDVAALSGHIAGEGLRLPPNPCLGAPLLQCPQCQDIVEDIAGLAANYNTPHPPTLD